MLTVVLPESESESESPCRYIGVVMWAVAPGSRRAGSRGRRVRGSTGLSSCWLLVVFIPGIWLAGSLVGSCTGAGSVSVVSAMGVNWFTVAVANCKMGLSGVTVPLVPVFLRVGINHSLSLVLFVLSM